MAKPTQNSKKRFERWGKWSHKLLEIIENADSPLYQDQIFEKDEDLIVIIDKFPKSKYHFLCLPRKIRIDEPSALTQEHVELLTKMLSKGRQVENELKRRHPEDKSLPFRFGFHVKPSMRQLHMHIISQDFTGRGLKTLKHWNSFNTSFFIDTEQLIETLKQHGHFKVPEKTSLLLQSLPLCPYCGQQFVNFNFFLQHWQPCFQKAYNQSSNNTNTTSLTNHS